MRNGASCLPCIILCFIQGSVDFGGIVGCLPDVDMAIFAQQFPGERYDFEFDLRDSFQNFSDITHEGLPLYANALLESVDGIFALLFLNHLGGGQFG